jgi:hypothetical protein
VHRLAAELAGLRLVILYHFDLYPRDDPRDGTLVVRFPVDKLQSAEYRGEANGTGAGNFSIRADTTEAQFIDPLGLQYVRVVEEDTVAVTETVVGGFFLETGDFQLLDERGTRLLKFGGAGTLSYLSRAVMAPHTYLDIAIGTDPYDDTWRLYEQGPAAGGDMLGAVLWRAVYEAQHVRVALTDHRHADGVIYTDSHADDRTVSAIPDLVLDFDGFDDSNGVDWDQPSGEFKAQVNENLLDVTQRLMQAGLYVEMDPDTFELRAWQADDHRRTRTGVAWGTTVVRFQAPTDGTIATGNIASDAVRKISAFIKRSLLWVGGGDVYSKVTGTTDIPWEGGYYSDVADTTALTQIGTTQIEARDDAGDTLHIVQLIRDEPTAGRYKPFRSTGVLLDDLVTVHTGTNQFDHDEQNFPVAAITVQLRGGGDWQAIYELGASFGAAGGRQFQVTPVPSHNHLPNPELCRPGTITSPTFEEGYGDAHEVSATYTFGLGVGGAGDDMFVLIGLEDPSESSNNAAAYTSVQWRPDGTVGSSVDFTKVYGKTVGGFEAWVLVNPTAATDASALVIANNSTAYSEVVGVAYVTGINAADPWRGIDIATGSGTVSTITPSAEDEDLVLNISGQLQNGVDASLAAPTAGGGQTSIQTDTRDAAFGQRDTSMGFGRQVGAAAATWTYNGSRPWWAMSIALRGEASGGDGSVEEIGTSIRAARCDHNHHHNSLLSLNTLEGGHDALAVNYDNTTSGLIADNTQDAIDELAASGGAVASSFPELTIDSDLMSSWWSGPKAVEVEYENIRYLLTSGVTSGGVIQHQVTRLADLDVTEFTLATHEDDDHNAAAIIAPTGKPRLLIYARHNEDATLRWRKATGNAPTASLNAEQTLTVTGDAITYASAYYRDTDEVYIWTRATVTAPRYWTMVWSTDYLATAPSQQRVFDFGSGEQGYIATARVTDDPDVLRVALIGHPTASTIHDIYYCEVNLDTGAITNQAGSTLGNFKTGASLPLTVTALDKAVDIDTGTYNARLFDIGGGDVPEILYAQWTGDTDAEYHLSWYDDSAWTTDAIVPAGDSFGYTAAIHYNGGAVFLDDTPGREVVLSREDAGTWYIEKWTRGSSAWVSQRLSTDSTDAIVRPFPVFGGTLIKQLWHKVSDYTHYLTWTASLVGVQDGEPGSESTITSALDDLSDVDATSPTTGYGLFFDGTDWAPARAPEPLTDESGVILINEDDTVTMSEPFF